MTNWIGPKDLEMFPIQDNSDPFDLKRPITQQEFNDTVDVWENKPGINWSAYVALQKKMMGEKGLEYMFNELKKMII